MSRRVSWWVLAVGLVGAAPGWAQDAFALEVTRAEGRAPLAGAWAAQLELSATRAGGSAQDFLGVQLLPQLAAAWGPVTLAAGSAVVLPLSGEGLPQLEPLLGARLQLGPALEVGADYTVALGAFAPVAEHVHRVFGVLTLVAQAWQLPFELEVAVGTGLTGPERLLFRCGLTVELEPGA